MNELKLKLKLYPPSVTVQTPPRDAPRCAVRAVHTGAPPAPARSRMSAPPHLTTPHTNMVVMVAMDATVDRRLTRTRWRAPAAGAARPRRPPPP